MKTVTGQIPFWWSKCGDALPEPKHKHYVPVGGFVSLPAGGVLTLLGWVKMLLFSLFFFYFTSVLKLVHILGLAKRSSVVTCFSAVMPANKNILKTELLSAESEINLIILWTVLERVIPLGTSKTDTCSQHNHNLLQLPVLKWLKPTNKRCTWPEKWQECRQSSVFH